MRFPQGAEWLIILLVILLLFGAKRLPDAARGLGRSLRILKAETKGLHDDGGETPEQLPAAPAREPLPPATPSAGVVDPASAARPVEQPGGESAASDTPKPQA